jgi:RimJ/RimL family protein N-acetyltransferase
VEPVTLRTERLVLRPYAASDVDAVYEAYQDPDIQHYTPAPTPYERADAERFVTGANRGGGLAPATGSAASAPRTARSSATTTWSARPRGVYEFGYWAVREQRGQGYSYEAAKALCEWGFATLDAHRIEWWAMVGNTGSRALAEKLGFVVEGLLRRRVIVDDEPRDWWVGGLLRSR